MVALITSLVAFVVALLVVGLQSLFGPPTHTLDHRSVEPGLE
ncbi:hypothetical protein [Natrialba chahannaoensis]|nr:hypothetical protein [Natrialba chahannaoensis]